MNSFVRQKFKS